MFSPWLKRNTRCNGIQADCFFSRTQIDWTLSRNPNENGEIIGYNARKKRFTAFVSLRSLTEMENIYLTISQVRADQLPNTVSMLRSHFIKHSVSAPNMFYRHLSVIGLRMDRRTSWMSVCGRRSIRYVYTHSAHFVRQFGTCLLVVCTCLALTSNRRERKQTNINAKSRKTEQWTLNMREHELCALRLNVDDDDGEEIEKSIIRPKSHGIKME